MCTRQKAFLINNYSNLFTYDIRARLFKPGLRQPKVISKFEFTNYSLKGKSNFICFAYNLISGYPKRNKRK